MLSMACYPTDVTCAYHIIKIMTIHFITWLKNRNCNNFIHYINILYDAYIEFSVLLTFSGPGHFFGNTELNIVLSHL